MVLVTGVVVLAAPGVATEALLRGRCPRGFLTTGCCPVAPGCAMVAPVLGRRPILFSAGGAFGSKNSLTAGMLNSSGVAISPTGDCIDSTPAFGPGSGGFDREGDLAGAAGGLPPGLSIPYRSGSTRIMSSMAARA